MKYCIITDNCGRREIVAMTLDEKWALAIVELVLTSAAVSKIHTTIIREVDQIDMVTRFYVYLS